MSSAPLPIAILALLGACASGRDVNPLDADLALVGGTVYPAPHAEPIADAVILVDHGLIAAVGGRDSLVPPSGARVVDLTGKVVTAGFWNAHVHFTEPRWQGADTAAADSLSAGLAEMLLQYGFVRVVDTGSDLANTLALRRRIDAGEVAGPAILTTGPGFVPEAGSPYYLAPLRLAELSRGSDARRAVRGLLGDGADAIKLFTSSWPHPDTMAVMSTEAVRAAVAAAHARGATVVAHPSDGIGAALAVEAGVDVLAHTFPTERSGPWDRSLPEKMRGAAVALIPTLSLWPWELPRAGFDSAAVDAAVAVARDQVRACLKAGVSIVFGTDVGYVTAYDPRAEYRALSAAGLELADLLAALTTAPAAAFGLSDITGRVEPGLDADLVVLDRDPTRALDALTAVRLVIRRGRVVFSAP